MQTEHRRNAHSDNDDDEIEMVCLGCFGHLNRLSFGLFVVLAFGSYASIWHLLSVDVVHDGHKDPHIMWLAILAVHFITRQVRKTKTEKEKVKLKSSHINPSST